MNLKIKWINKHNWGWEIYRKVIKKPDIFIIASEQPILQTTVTLKNIKIQNIIYRSVMVTANGVYNTKQYARFVNNSRELQGKIMQYITRTKTYL